jgi:hypothetical protein
MRNPVYAGKIYLPSFKEEEEMYVQGQHEPIIEEDLFWEVQSILDGRTPKNTKKTKQKDELPLRGFLECARCGGVLTGSGSRGKLGNRYFYYHCRNGCPERFQARKANAAFVDLLGKITAKHEAMDLYYEVLKDAFKDSDVERLKKVTNLKLEIDRNTERVNKAMQMMLDGELNST